MKKLKFILAISLFMPALVWAKGGDHIKKPNNSQVGLAAGCAPATDFIFLEFNNVRTFVYAGARQFQNEAQSLAGYEVPKGSNSFALFAGGVWMFGVDVNGQLKGAASLFGNGVDYWTGPLDIEGTAEIDDATCQQFDRFFKITRAEVAQFVAYRAALEAGTANEDFPNYQIPSSILDWPANGDLSKGQDFRIAPYVNVGGDETYEPLLGDYPFFDLVGDVDCRENRENRSINTRRPLFGDEDFYWIFNDKGNVHTETNAPSIGMEVHAQAFAFATNDEINDMTFFNYELINRSTFTLSNTYFANYVDPDLGNSADDYVGCDVVRGLGYCFNGDDFDESVRGQTGYGNNPAAIGIDFFEGPFQDADGVNNLVGIGPGQALNGLGYFDPAAREPDLVPDNERFGMRRFMFYNIGNGINGDPELAIHYYNYMRGIWKNGQLARHGGDGFQSPAVENIPTAFMFPGDSDPLHWGTTDEFGFTTVPANTRWTEDNPGAGEDANPPGDRRFLQSAGPFTLEPGNVNDMTVGIVFAQASSGGRLASVEDLFRADDKAQSLFDNCFQVLNGPDAPDVDVQELDQTLIFYLSNPSTSNNFQEGYEERDPNIVTPDSLANQGIFFDDLYRFQGYQVYQLAGEGISINDLDDPSKARLLFQSDIKDDVVNLTNFTFDRELNANVPVQEVVAANDGIQRSFEVTEDLFATGNARLINFKTYYYLAVAYGHNEFKQYVQGVAPDPADPFAPAFDGQTTPYISSRRNGVGGAVAAFTAIPHGNRVQSGGTIVNSSFGDEIQITRLQGRGNGGNELRITDASIDDLFTQATWEVDTIPVGPITYEAGQGPFEVQIIDPLNVVEGTYYLQIVDGAAELTDTSRWRVWRDGGTDTVLSQRTIAFENEQLLLNPNWGLSIFLTDGDLPGSRNEETANGFISASIEYDQPELAWLVGISDDDSESPLNWILSGDNSQSTIGFNDRTDATNTFSDPDENYESILSGTFAPYHLTRWEILAGQEAANANPVGNDNFDIRRSPLSALNSIQLVITSDKSRWTRCPVVETKDDGARDVNGNVIVARNQVKLNLSVDKDGNSVDTTGLGNMTVAEIEQAIRDRGDTTENDAGFVSAFGMGWFPGYVFNKETGERLNMVFGEDSRYSFNNGDDMMWNPTSTINQGILSVNRVWGGKHFIYIFRKTLEEEITTFPPFAVMPEYDNGAKLKELLSSTNQTIRRFGWSSCAWTGVPILTPGMNVLATDVRVDVNVSRPYGVQDSDIDAALDNDGKPVYEFNTIGRGPIVQSRPTLDAAIESIGVVPNPYYALSEYERDQIENVVKFINLPQVCKITIYNSNGTLIRTYNKASPQTFLDWDLNNQANVPIASGVYIIHVEVPGVGEKILKWFGVVRPVDLNNF